jgi:hypothetical protein
LPESPTPATFTPHVGTAFEITFTDGILELTLESVAASGTRAPRPDVPGLRTEPFSLFFLGPLQPALPQRTWDLAHPVLGVLAIFLVPIGPMNGRMRYEAVFN